MLCPEEELGVGRWRRQHRQPCALALGVAQHVEADLLVEPARPHSPGDVFGVELLQRFGHGWVHHDLFEITAVAA